jgi:hypothetical protein
VPVEEEPRASLLGEAGRVVVDGGRVVGLRDERPSAPERLGAVVGDLEAARARGARSAEQADGDGEADREAERGADAGLGAGAGPWADL